MSSRYQAMLTAGAFISRGQTLSTGEAAVEYETGSYEFYQNRTSLNEVKLDLDYKGYHHVVTVYVKSSSTGDVTLYDETRKIYVPMGDDYKSNGSFYFNYGASGPVRIFVDGEYLFRIPDVDTLGDLGTEELAENGITSVVAMSPEAYSDGC